MTRRLVVAALAALVGISLVRLYVALCALLDPDAWDAWDGGSYVDE